eukprot:4101288-Pyramimonas_sp.AAC.1
MAFLGFEGGVLDAEVPRSLVSLAAELQGAQWALARFLHSAIASLGHEYAVCVHCDNMEALRVARGGRWFARSIEWVHVPGHSAHAWNEFVDAVATLIPLDTGNVPFPDCSWRCCLQDLQAMQWLWLRFEPPQVQGQYLSTRGEVMPPLVETAREKAAASGKLPPPIEATHTSSSTLWVAAANVLSLSPGSSKTGKRARPAGLFPSGRITQLSAAFKQQNLFLVGTVETRLA